MTCFPMDVPTDVPHRSAILKCDPIAPRTARALARPALDEWGLTAVQDDVELVTSELVTNALRQGTMIVFFIAWCSGTDEVVVAVRDDGPGLPEMRPHDLESESGRGLLMVRARSNTWGCRPGINGTGKTVWAALGPKPRDDRDAES